MFKCSKFDNILKSYHENKLAHAFLLETNDSLECYKDLIQLIKLLNCPYEYSEECQKDCNLCNLIDAGNLPSLIEIRPDGNFIKKNQILEMMERFSSKPVFSRYNIYIVHDCDHFNDSSANTILKFLEEPNDNIIGFFITNNKMNVISTIRSRCQNFSMSYKDIKKVYDENDILLFNEYFNNIYQNKDDLLYNKNVMSKQFNDRIEWQLFFNKLFIYVSDICTFKVTCEIEVFNKISKNNMIKVLELLEKILKYINSNGNIELILDKFVIEMRKYYE